MLFPYHRTDEEINRLADGICVYLEWQARMMTLKADLKTRRMIEAQRRRAFKLKMGETTANPPK